MSTATEFKTLGDRMKSYEAPSISRKAVKGQPLIARLDGRSFHTFTKGLHRPFDLNLSSIMVGLATALAKEFNALIGYVQSDEITLIWFCEEDSVQEYPFAGRFQKIESVLASFAGAWFAHKTSILGKQDELATFDCRAFSVPSKEEAINELRWRQWDATKNAVSMAAHSYFSNKVLHGLNRGEMIDLLKKEADVDFSSYPYFFKRGTFVRSQTTLKFLTPAELEKIPPSHRPNGPVNRSEMVAFDMNISDQVFIEDVVFNKEQPLHIES